MNIQILAGRKATTMAKKTEAQVQTPDPRTAAQSFCEANGYQWNVISHDGMFEVLRVGEGRLTLGRCFNTLAGWERAVELVAHKVGIASETVTGAVSTETETLTPDLSAGMQERQVSSTPAVPDEAAPV
jgi:hypothetical protein